MSRVVRAINAIVEAPGEEMFEKIASIVESQTRRRITDEKTDPEGKPWRDWSEVYAASQHGTKRHKPHPGQLRRAGGHSILELMGHLRDSIGHVIGERSVAVGVEEAGVTAEVKYGAAMQATRPFLGLSDSDEIEIVEIIADFIEREMMRQ
jgi:phage gpG-like protein